MTTLIAKLSPGLAKRLAAAADRLGLTHEETAIQALRLFTRACASASLAGGDGPRRHARRSRPTKKPRAAVS